MQGFIEKKFKKKSIPKFIKMDAQKEQQLTAQGIALGFCVGVGIIKGVSKF